MLPLFFAGAFIALRDDLLRRSCGSFPEPLSDLRPLSHKGFELLARV